MACAALAMLSMATVTEAHPGIILGTTTSGDSSDLQIGQQLLIEKADGEINFAGQKLSANGFTGILGFASEVAYAVVIEGKLQTGTETAGGGAMVLVPPYGSEPVVQRYDAARLIAGWDTETQARHPDAFDGLGQVAKRQKTAIRFGRLGRTNLNIAAPGGTQAELARRSTKGGNAVQDIRFSGKTDMAAIETMVIDRFLAALIAGDTETVATLLDPTPFGASSLEAEASGARQLAARTLVRQRDWKATLGTTRPERDSDGNVWTLRDGGNEQGTITLRPVGDFVFVRAIRMGGV